MKEKQTLLNQKGFKIDDSWHCFMAEFCRKEITKLNQLQRILERISINSSFRIPLINNLKDLEDIVGNIAMLPNNSDSHGIYIRKYELEQCINSTKEFLRKNLKDVAEVRNEVKNNYLPNLDRVLESLIESLKHFERNAEKHFECIDIIKQQIR
jgi:hypothetical protein